MTNKIVKTVQVVRFLRPEWKECDLLGVQDTLHKNSDKGITFVFFLHYFEDGSSLVEAKASVCNGVNFRKSSGTVFAMRNAPIYVGDFSELEGSLVTGLVNKLLLTLTPADKPIIMSMKNVIDFDQYSEIEITHTLNSVNKDQITNESTYKKIANLINRLNGKKNGNI